MSMKDKAPKNSTGRYIATPGQSDPNQTIEESLSHLPPELREKVEKGMSGAPPIDIEHYVEHLTRTPLTVENIAAAMVDELIRRGYFPAQPETDE